MEVVLYCVIAHRAAAAWRLYCIVSLLTVPSLHGGCTVLCHYSPCRRCMEVVLYCVITHRAVAAWSCPVTDDDDAAAVNSLK